MTFCWIVLARIRSMYVEMCSWPVAPSLPDLIRNPTTELYWLTFSSDRQVRDDGRNFFCVCMCVICVYLTRLTWGLWNTFGGKVSCFFNEICVLMMAHSWCLHSSFTVPLIYFADRKCRCLYVYFAFSCCVTKSELFCSIKLCSLSTTVSKPDEAGH